MSRIRRGVAAFTFAAVLGAPIAARAQTPPSDATPAPKAVPPKVVSRVDPPYPAGHDETADVLLDFTIDTTGAVTDVAIAQSSGVPDFDRAALDAAKSWTFAPASIDGAPIVARTRQAVHFTAPAASAKPTVSTGIVRGVVTTPAGDPLPASTITFLSGGGVVATALTGDDGRFSQSVADGKYTVRVEAVGFKPYSIDEEVKAGAAIDLPVKLDVSGEAVQLVVTGEKPPREVVKRQLDQREILRAPGTNGDALRSLQNLPGVARPPGFAGLLIIRGSAPQDTNVFIDGTLVPIVYHFGGLSSVVPTELLDRIDFYPGNFGPEYGRVMGGIVDVGIRSPNKEKWTGLLQFDLIDGRILAEGPIDDKTRVAVAGRRSWVDAWLGPVLRQAGAGVSTAPVYYDYQVMVERDLSQSTTARLLFFGSDDRLAITLNSPSDSDPALGGDVSTHTGFWRLQGRIDTKVGKDVRWTNTVATGTDLVDFGLGNYFFKLTSHPISYRSDLRVKVANEAAFVLGTDFLYSAYDVALKFPPLPRPGETPGPFFARPAPELDGKGGFLRPAFYGLFELSPTKRLKLIPALRLDYAKDTGEWVLSPRFVSRYELVNEFPKTTLKAAFGVFHQAPQPNESIAPFGTPGVHDNRATHYDIGVEQEFTRQVELTVDAFYKDLADLVEPTPNASSKSGLSYSNTGSGRVYGLELLLRYKPDDRFFGWVAYTLSRSERRDAPGDPMRLFEFDQTHIFTILGSYRLGRGWEVGLRWRYVSGSMYTPNIGGVSDFDAGAYAPISSYPPFGSRLPAFHQLDVRVDKRWDFGVWRLGIYLDLENAYNRKNPEAITYNYNYSLSTTVSGLPILPVLGVRGEI